MAPGRVDRIPRLAVLISLLVLVVCFTGSAYLYQEQIALLDVLRAKRANYDAVSRSEKWLITAIVALQTGTDADVDAANDGLHASLLQARRAAETAEEVGLSERALAAFTAYRQSWERRAAGDGPERMPRDGLVTRLREQVRPLCHRIQDVDFAEAEATEQELARSMRTAAWWLGAAGVLGSLAALVLGHSRARVVRRSLHRLSVRLRGATEQLDQSLPSVTLDEHGDFERVHRQVQELTAAIEKVVGRLQQREREVLRAEQLAAVGQVAAGVAHELRNPLTSIKLLVHAHRREAEAAGLPAEDFDILSQEIRRMDQCLQAFLDFARPPKAVRRPADLVRLVERALTLVGGRARKQKVDVAFAPPAGAFVVEVDAEQVVQVLVNLTLNALDAMPRGGRLTVDLGRTGDGRVRLRVLDDGPGVPAEVLPRLFEPFVSGKETGLGLGLALSRQLAEGHGGTLHGGNRPGGGACFELCLPEHGDAAGPR